MDMAPVLIALDGPLAGARYPITAEALRLGREPGNEVHIDDSNVSRQHARVLLHNGAVWVQDAGSRNGVFVNAQRVADHKQVKVGDKVSVSGHQFEIGLAEVTPAPAGASDGVRPPSAGPRGALWIALAVALLGVVVWWLAAG